MIFVLDRRGSVCGLCLMMAVAGLACTRSSPPEVPEFRPPRKVVLDLSRLEEIGGPTGEMLRRYVAMIQLQHQDFNGRVLTIRRDDLRAIACILDTPSERAGERLADLGILLQGAPVLDGPH